MSFTDKINADIKTAMLAKDKERLAALRDIKSKLLLEATSGAGEVTDEIAAKVVLKLYKQRIDTYNLYIEQNRQDLADEELVQAKVIEEYMPKQLSDEEVRTEVKNAIQNVGASGPADMGKVMGVLTKQLAGKADGKVISAIVKEELAK
ncbi:MAG: GatB/YqeY domain-containing protein [Crocinitomicaceae bacterium]|nr:GatB/YqeY domain-containing protein [Crocinitomicaceae bacterium]